MKAKSKKVEKAISLMSPQVKSQTQRIKAQSIQNEVKNDSKKNLIE